MFVQVKLYAMLSRYARGVHPGLPLQVEIPEGYTLADLAAQLKIPAGETHIAYVNGVVQSLDQVLHPGDDVGLFPPVGGG